MSKLIASAAIRGANKLVKQAEEMLEKAIAEKGKDFAFEFPDTAFYLPMIYAMTAFPCKDTCGYEGCSQYGKGITP